MQNRLVNCIPWSVKTLFSMPCLQTTYSQQIHANSGESISCQQGRWITILDYGSTIIEIPEYLKLVDSTRLPNKSITILSHRWYIGSSGRLAPDCTWCYAFI